MTPRRALIEEQMPLTEVNAESARDKALRHGHISTIHLWWARRPLSMARAVVFASLISDPGEEGRTELLRLIGQASRFEESNGHLATELRRRISEEWPDQKPKVLDSFAGGGAIPLEAARLGCDVTASDVNPVAHLIQRCVLEYPAVHGQPGALGDASLSDDFVRYAEWVGRTVDSDLERFYPRPTSGGRIATYFWARTIPCPDPMCGITIPVVSSRRMVDSTRNTIRLDYDPREDRVELRVRAGEPTDGSDWTKGTKTVRGSSVTVTCPVCGAARPDKELRAYAKEHGFGDYLYGVMEIRDGSRIYREPSASEVKAPETAAARVAALEPYEDGTSAVPDEMLVPSQYRILRTLTFGIDSWAAMFTPRQQLVLASLARTVREAYVHMLAEGMDAGRAKAITTYLALAVDRSAAYNSSLCGWHVGYEKVRDTFPQQTLSLTWDYVEIDPFSSASGSWSGAVAWIRKVIDHCALTNPGNPARVVRADAQRLPYGTGEFDAVIVDPPYYDAFQYSDLSDFFYVWLKRSVGHLYPELFSTPLTPKQAEVIENRADKKSPEYISHDEFERRLQNALDELKRVVKDDGLVALVFAHTDVEAWERLLVGLRRAKLVVTTSWPMRSEMANRSNARHNAVLSSSVVLVCRKAQPGRVGFYDDVVRGLEQRIEERLATFEDMSLIGADYFVSAVGPAFEVFAQYERVERLSGEEVTVDQLMVLARRAVARHALRRLLGGDTLVALDDRSLFYLTWRWAYDGLAIPADETYMLCRAFDVDLDVLTRDGDLVRKEGSGKDLKYRLLGPADRGRIDLGVTPSLVDIMHIAAQLHADGRRNDLVEVLAETGAGTEPGFWAMVSAVTEALPDGSRERTMLLGLGGSRERLSEEAKHHVGPAEALTLNLDS